LKNKWLLYLVRQVALDPKTNEMSAATFASKLNASSKISREILEAAGLESPSRDQDYGFPEGHERIPAMNEIYGRYFTARLPRVPRYKYSLAQRPRWWKSK